MIKNIIFDLGNVLLDLDQQKCIESFRQMGAHDILAYINSHAGQGLFEKMETGKISAAEFRDEVRSIVGRQLSDEEINGAWNTFIVDFPINRLKMLQRIKPHYKIFVLSNTSPIHADYFENMCFINSGIQMHDLFDKVYYSFDVQIAKPSRKIYEFVLKDAQILPHETLFIDDAKPNIEAALEAGMNIIHSPAGEEVADLDFNNPTNNPNFEASLQIR